MKKLIILIAFLAGLSFDSIAQLTHPGVMLNLADLNRMKNRKTFQPWKAGYEQVVAFSSYTKQGPAANVGNQPDPNLNTYRNDCIAAYRLAVLWYVNNDTAAAIKATDIVNSWAITHTSWSGITKTGLTRGEYGFQLIAAAEILRYTYYGWTATNTSNCVSYFNALYWDTDGPWTNPATDDFGTGNQGISLLVGMMAEAIFVNDTAKYNFMVAAFRTNYCASLSRNSKASGQNGETGRDQAHSMLEVIYITQMAEMAKKQGTDIYSDLGNRVLAINEHWCRYNLGLDVPYEAFGPCSGPYNAINDYNRGIYYPNNTLEWAIGEYVTGRALSAPYTLQYRELCTPSHETFMYRKEAVPVIPDVPVVATPAVGYNQVVLEWRHASGAATYKVKRATTSGGPYTVLASGIGSASYVDKSVVNGTKYYYTVSSTGLSESADAPEVAARPKEWTLADADIGTVPIAGSSSRTNGNWTVSGSGADISGANDRLHFTYTKMIGSGSITARVTSSTGGKGGLMLRSGMDSSASMVMMIFDGNQIRMAFRRFNGDGNTYYSNANGAQTPPKWLRITRSGGIFQTYYSVDSASWIFVGSTEINMPQVIPIGLAMCGRGALRTITYDNLTIKGISTTPAGLSGISLNSSSNKLTWNSAEDAGSYSLYRAAAPGGPYTLAKNGITDTTYTDTGLVRATYYYVVTATSMYGEGLNSVEIAVAPVPNAPSGLSAIPSNAQVFLHWNTSDGVTKYKVKRSVTSGGSYTLIDSATTAAYTDVNVINGTTYYYVISAQSSVGESGNSTPVSATPAANLPATYRWQGGVNNVWDLTTANWKSNGTDAMYQNGGGVVFNDSALATARISFSQTMSPAYILANNSTLIDTLAGILAGSMKVIKNGSKNFALSGNNTFTGGIILNEGSLNPIANSSMGTGQVTLNGGTLQLNNNNTVFTNNTLVNGTATIAAGNTAGARSVTYNGVLSGTGTVTFMNNSGNNFPFNIATGGNWLNFTGTLIHDGGFVARDFPLNVTPNLNLVNAKVILQQSNFARGSASAAVNLNATSGKSYFGSLTQSGTRTTYISVAGGGTLSIGNLGATTSYGGVISGAGSIALTGGTLTLSGVSTYSGATSVTNSNLIVTGSLSNTSQVTIDSAATLAGTGTMGGVVSLANGATLSLVNTAAGPITFSNRFAPSGGCTINLELGTTSISDRIILTGSGTTYTNPANGIIRVNATALSTFGGLGSYPIISGAAGIDAAYFAVGTVPDNDYDYSFSVSGNTLYLNISVMPNAPSSLTASSGSASSVVLGWIAPTGATTYNVKRSTISSGPYTTIESGITGTSYTDNTASGGATYYYVVTGSSASGEGPNSNEATVAVILPARSIVLTTEKGTGNTVNIAWQTTNEVNVKNLQLEHSPDGAKYTVLTTLSARNSAANRYSFTHLQPGKAGNFYRVKVTDLDGASRHSAVKYLSFKNTTQWSIYPNPVVNGQLQLLMESTIPHAMVEVYDVNGKLRLSRNVLNLAGMYTLPLNGALSSGMYLLKINGQGTKTFFMVQ